MSVRWSRILGLVLVLLLGVHLCLAQVKLAQLSDTHLRSPDAPRAVENLKKAVQMINDRGPDVVIVTGDIAESPEGWQEARDILKELKAPVHYVPGNHDVKANPGDVEKWRGVFGKDYYKFKVKNVTLVSINSQLLGNFDNFSAKEPPPLPAEVDDESEKMLTWMGQQSKIRVAQATGERFAPAWQARGVVVGFQHVPLFRTELEGGQFPIDPKPYWVVSEPYRGKEMKLLKQLGIKHMFVGHWHRGVVYDAEGITWHVAPSTARILWGGTYGFALHTIEPNGAVRTEFVDIK